MAKGHKHFVKAAGVFYVASSLAVRQMSALLTLGNAPSVDVLASSAIGRQTLATQVKAQRNAYRRERSTDSPLVTCSYHTRPDSDGPSCCATAKFHRSIRIVEDWLGGSAPAR